MIYDSLTGTLEAGKPYPQDPPPPPSPLEIAANAAQWRAVAQRLVAGEFDSKGRPPTGSLAKSLWIGMRQQPDEPIVQKALRHLGKLEETDEP